MELRSGRGKWRYTATEDLAHMIFVLTISCKQERPTGMVPSVDQVSSWQLCKTVLGLGNSFEESNRCMVQDPGQWEHTAAVD